MLLRKRKSTRFSSPPPLWCTRLEDLTQKAKHYCLFLFNAQQDCSLFCHNNSQACICQIGRGLVRHLNVYSSFEFPIPVNITLGYGGNGLRGGSAMKHEQPCCRPTRKRTRQNEVWHFIIRDEGLGQQTMHFNWHTSLSSTVSTIAGVRCSMRCLPQIITAQLHQSRWLLILLYDQFHSF